MPVYSTPLYWSGVRFPIVSGNLARAVKRSNRGATASEFLGVALLDRDAAVLFGNRPSMDELSKLAAVLYDDARDALPQAAADPVELMPRERAVRPGLHVAVSDSEYVALKPNDVLRVFVLQRNRSGDTENVGSNGRPFDLTFAAVRIGG